MFENILTPSQAALAEKLFPFVPDFYLAGGTAIALQIGHRQSIDFDLASPDPVSPFNLERTFISNNLEIQDVLTATGDEYSIILGGTKVTFFLFPFPIMPKIEWESVGLKIPELIQLGAMKAYALGRRNKWKDYVDLFFLLKFHLTMRDLIDQAEKTFGKYFNAKLFREQLCYFKDIDYSERIDYIGYSLEDEEIKEFLVSIATDI